MVWSFAEVPVSQEAQGREEVKRKYPNVIQCLVCRKVLVSNYQHDYNGCGCSNETHIDGGYDYLRIVAKDIEKVAVLKLIKAKSRWCLKKRKGGKR